MCQAVHSSFTIKVRKPNPMSSPRVAKVPAARHGLKMLGVYVSSADGTANCSADHVCWGVSHVSTCRNPKDLGSWL